MIKQRHSLICLGFLCFCCVCVVFCVVPRVSDVVSCVSFFNCQFWSQRPQRSLLIKYCFCWVFLRQFKRSTKWLVFASVLPQYSHFWCWIFFSLENVKDSDSDQIHFRQPDPFHEIVKNRPKSWISTKINQNHKNIIHFWSGTLPIIHFVLRVGSSKHFYNNF